MSITALEIGVSPKLHEVFNVFTCVNLNTSRPFKFVLVTDDEYRSAYYKWSRVEDRYHVIVLSDLETACDVIERYCNKYPMAVNAVDVGVPTLRYNQYRENNGSSSKQH